MINKDFTWPTFRLFLVIYLPLVLIITLGSYAVYYYYSVKSHRAIVKQREISLLQFQSEYVENEIKSVVTDLRVIAADPAIEAYVETGLQPNETLTESMLMAFSRYKGVYDQIRLLDTTGMEILRINLRNDHPYVVPLSELQFKGKRYYFKDTFRLSKDEVFISPFDLNIEHGRIERPLKPMIRFGMPVFDRRLNKRGIIIVNYLGRQILTRLESHHRNMPGLLMVLNKDGYWLKGPTVDDEWGFMFEEKKENTFNSRFSEEWIQIANAEKGQFLTPHGLYTFSTVYPLRHGTVSSTGSHLSDKESDGYLSQSDFFWKIISFVPVPALYAESRNLSLLLIITDIVVFVLLGFLSWRMAQASIQKKQVEFALRKSHAELELIVNDRTAKLIEANEALKHKIQEHQRTIKEKDEMANQLRQSQKMEAIGTLASGIAHDFNNILSIILGYAELAGERLLHDDKSAAHLNEIIKAGNRARDLVKQILTFSRQTDKDLKPLKISLIIKEAVKLLRASIPSTIQIQENIAPDSGMVLADVTHIHQIIMNLCTNAYHAMSHNGGVLTITSKSVHIDQIETTASQSQLMPGDYVLLEVKDTGRGMDPKTLNRIYDPYFTTKKMGEGTGLGLSVVHGIIKSYDGHIEVQSEPGVGTTFRLYFPQVVSMPIREVDQKESLPPRGTERILLVDDEESILEAEHLMLESLGYKVTPFADAARALHAFQQQPQNFDIIVTDMTMPNMTGAELIQRIRRLRSTIPVILCTGFSQQIDEKKAIALGIHGFIMKPIVKMELASMVRKVLDKFPVSREEVSSSLNPSSEITSAPPS